MPMFLDNLKASQLEEILESLMKKVEHKPYTATGYFHMKKQIAEIKEEFKKRGTNEF